MNKNIENLNCDIIVVGGNHHNTYGVIRSLHMKGVRPIVAIHSNDGTCYFRKSSFAKEVVIVSNEEEIISWLKKRKHGENKDVLIACSDSMSYLLDKNCQVLLEHYFLPGAGGILGQMMDKKYMAELASNAGILTPGEVVWNSSEDFKSVLGEIDFPVILKPLQSIEGSKSDIHVCNSLSEVEELNEHTGCPSFIAQKYINKRFEYQVIGVSLREGVIMSGVTKLIRPSAPNTNTGIVELSDGSNIGVDFEAIRRFIGMTKYKGLFSIEFLRGTDGKDYFMEINFRNDGNAIVATTAGINLSWIWVADCLEMDYADSISNTPTETRVMPWFIDLFNVVRRRLSLSTFLSDSRSCKAYMDISWNDPKVILNIVLTISKYTIKRVFRRK